MSYDVTVTYGVCAHCGRGDSSFDWNYTSNCGPMWRLAGADLSEFHGKTAGACAPVLRAALGVLRADPERFRALDPPNKWGSYETLLPALDKLLAALERDPDARVRVTW